MKQFLQDLWTIIQIIGCFLAVWLLLTVPAAGIQYIIHRL